MCGYPETIITMVQLFYLYWGIPRVQGSTFNQLHQSLITIRDLYQLVHQLSYQYHHNQYMLYSTITLAFAGLLNEQSFTYILRPLSILTLYCWCPTFIFLPVMALYMFQQSLLKLICLNLAAPYEKEQLVVYYVYFKP